MLTLLTRTTLKLLNCISNRGIIEEDDYQLSSGRPITELLDQLERGGLIQHLSEPCSSYVLRKPFYSITLLEVLEVTSEHLDCNYEVREDFYIRYGVVAQKLGIISQLTRSYLSEIKVMDIRLDESP